MLETLDYACKVLNIRRKQAEDLARRGILPIVRVGRQVRVSPPALDEWIASGGAALPGGWRRSADPAKPRKKSTPESRQAAPEAPPKVAEKPTVGLPAGAIRELDGMSFIMLKRAGITAATEQELAAKIIAIKDDLPGMGRLIQWAERNLAVTESLRKPD